MAKYWTPRYTLLILILFGLALWAAGRFDEYVFNDVSGQSVARLLTPLFLIGLFIERALEVFITAWREPGKQEIRARMDALKKPAEIVAPGGERVIPRGRARAGADAPGSELTGLEEAEVELATYKAHTQRFAFLIGLSAGILISIAGVRVLHPLVNWDADIAGAQDVVFDTIDIFVTGGLLGGGAEGIHRLVSVITDFLDFTRKRIQAQTPAVPRCALAPPACVPAVLSWRASVCPPHSEGLWPSHRLGTTPQPRA
jgi:cytochrome b subunit of formate dehydrogenase